MLLAMRMGAALEWSLEGSGGVVCGVVGEVSGVGVALEASSVARPGTLRSQRWDGLVGILILAHSGVKETLDLRGKRARTKIQHWCLARSDTPP